jgi:hypothetical protein
LINRIVALNPTWTPPPPPPPPDSTTGDAPPAPPAPPNNPNLEFAQMMQTTITDFRTIAFAPDSPAVTSTTELTSTNTLLKTSIDDLRGTIQDWSVQIVNTSTTNQPGDMTGNEG